MKDTHLFYAVCIIAAFAVAAVGIGYATDMLPLHKQGVATTATPTTQPEVETVKAAKTVTVEEKKGCGCCAERRSKYQEMMKKRRERQKDAATVEQMASK